MKSNLYSLIFILSMISQATLKAQTTCVGESIKFQETFGTGNYSSSLPAGRTTYDYNGYSALEDGDYKLSKTTQGKPEWISAPDHTGDVNGKMMVINASFTAGEFYRDTVAGIASGKFYTVYMYVMNVNTQGTCGASAILPKIQFIVEYYTGNNSWSQVTSFSSAFIPQTATPTWVKVGGGFIAPNGVSSIRYRIINNSVGGCGNDLAIDDITFSQCASAAVLPIKGLTINVEQKNSAAVINFSTETEENTKTFETEKSYDGITWNIINTQAAAGNSSVKRSYTTTDANLSAKTVYYRIKETDYDGRFTWSPVITFNLDEPAQTAATAYPNPFTDNLSLQYKSSQNEVAVVRLVDQAGRTVKNTTWTLRKGTNIIQLDNVEKLQTGFYVMELRNTAGVKLYAGSIVKR